MEINKTNKMKVLEKFVTCSNGHKSLLSFTQKDKTKEKVCPLCKIIIKTKL